MCVHTIMRFLYIQNGILNVFKQFVLPESYLEEYRFAITVALGVVGANVILCCVMCCFFRARHRRQQREKLERQKL